ncbi:ABC transporter substrate-binding protein [Bosea sp. 685]|uniref:ABC transporter substrate-binding protein n=1 Tax=Bosea sp. 685 TaxID=3080057 RepID=UPI0028929D6C|nr:ABC transporter substrate-binding protein [Bosea sp. 685]WNJ93207.1 ABC transporter substrate-binding protein [Bosea sp. 685]
MTLTSRSLLAALAFCLPAAVSAQELPARIKTAGKIIVATQPNYPPIIFKDPATNTLAGLDIEIGEAIGKELGVAIEWQETAFAQMLPSLQTGRVDMVMAGMSDKPARRETADFIDYFSSGAQFYTITALAPGLKTMEDLCGKTVGASRATSWLNEMEDWSKENCVAKGKPALTIVGTEGSVDARTQLKTQRLQAAVQGSEVMPYFLKLEPNTYVPIGAPFTDVRAGIPFVKTPEGNQLRDAVKGALDRLKAKGTYDAIFVKYGLPSSALPKITINEGK